MRVKARINTVVRIGLVLALGGLMSGCGVSIPKNAERTLSPDRSDRRPHTAMRGPGYKRLILTLNESHHLNLRTNEYADTLEASGKVDPMTLLDARQLADDVAKFADDVEWSLTNNQRMKWHRTRMDELWDRHVAIYPQDAQYADSFRTKEMRKRTFKVRLKREYREKWDLDFEKVRDNVMERQKQAYLESL